MQDEPQKGSASPEGPTPTHLDEEGHARMVDVGPKEETHRTATASGVVRMSPAALQAVRAGALPKGDVAAAARIAGIQAAKRTAEWIPLCHPIRLTRVSVELQVDDAAGCVRLSATVEARDRTGVEMEALTAVSAAALTVYDMAKSVDRGMMIGPVRLESKAGGRSGVWQREHDAEEVGGEGRDD